MKRTSFDWTDQTLETLKSKKLNIFDTQQKNNATKEERVNLLPLCMGLKPSLSSKELKDSSIPAQILSESKTQASSTSGQVSFTNSPVLQSLTLGDEVPTEKLAPMIKKKEKKPTYSLPSKSGKYFCQASYKAAPKASALPKLTF